MNIFFLHVNPKQSAKYYFNKHCIKIILEIAQMLYTAHWMIGGDVVDAEWISQHFDDLQLKPYRKTHYNHPTSKWIRQSRNNYLYACNMGLALCYEYTRRYGKIHKTQQRLEWLIQHAPTTFVTDKIQGHLATKGLPTGCTAIPLAMPEAYHSDDAIQSYRQYYIHDKKSIAQSEDVWQQLRDEWCIQ